ncbi:uncharacterized protein LOC131619210 [Vicia villosa]|uniref:uncharacterized protein LOC131619210 n=1 Tax=Vicia villosa TaxID=3911 RepID=UPI00273C128E|nr:uncharacterized protein LOC131619210 [Vicia villosa]
MGYWRGNVWFWTVIRAEEVLGLDAITELEELRILLRDVNLRRNVEDVLIWPFDASKCFTVRSCYNIIMQDLGVAVPEDGFGQGLKVIWEAQIPSKVQLFGWRMLRDSLPTRNQLLKRRIIQHIHEDTCIFCEQQKEDNPHLFMLCPMIQRLWRNIAQWLDIDNFYAADCCSQLLIAVNMLSGRIPTKRVAAIWLTAWWCIWKMRNNMIFNNAVFDSDELFYSIIWYSWWWLAIAAKDRIKCNLYEWFKNPLLCI